MSVGEKPAGFPVEVLTKIVKHADERQFKTLRLVNWTFCNAVDRRIWRDVTIVLNGSESTVTAVENRHLDTTTPRARFVVPKGSISKLKCLERNAGHIEWVNLRTSDKFSIDDAVQTFAVLASKGVNIGVCSLELPTWGVKTTKEFRKKANSRASNWNPLVLIHLLTPSKEGAALMVEAVCPPSLDERLEINIGEVVGIKGIPFSLFLAYGDTITSLRLDVPDGEATARLIKCLEFCTKLDKLYITMRGIWDAYDSIPQFTKLILPESVTIFTLDPPTKVPSMTIVANNVCSFYIDCSRFPSTLQLKFASLEELRLSNCALAEPNLVFMIALMGKWNELELDTAVDAELLKFKSVIRSTKKVLNISKFGDSTAHIGFDYLTGYTRWLKEMKESISQLESITLKFPVLPPEKLKRFIVDSVCPVLPNVTSLYFIQSETEALARMKRLYPFLKVVRKGVYYMDGARLKKLQAELTSK